MTCSRPVMGAVPVPESDGRGPPCGRAQSGFHGRASKGYTFREMQGRVQTGPMSRPGNSSSAFGLPIWPGVTQMNRFGRKFLFPPSRRANPPIATSGRRVARLRAGGPMRAVPPRPMVWRQPGGPRGGLRKGAGHGGARERQRKTGARFAQISFGYGAPAGRVFGLGDAFSFLDQRRTLRFACKVTHFQSVSSVAKGSGRPTRRVKRFSRPNGSGVQCRGGVVVAVAP